MQGHRVALLPDTAVLAVDDIVDGCAAGERDLSQVPEHVVLVDRGQRPSGLRGELAIGRIRVGRTLVVEEPVVCVVVGDFEAVHVGAVAVLVVGVVGDDDAVLPDLGEAPGEVVGVGVDGLDTAEGLGLLGDAAEHVAGITRFVEHRRALAVLGFEPAQKPVDGSGLGPILRQRRMILAEGPDDLGLERFEGAAHFRDGERETRGRLDQITRVDLEPTADDVADRADVGIDLGYQSIEIGRRRDGLGAMRRELPKPL